MYKTLKILSKIKNIVILQKLKLINALPFCTYLAS